MERSSTIRGVVFDAIPPEQIRAAYNIIEKDLQKVISRSYSDWIPADVYSALRNGTSELVVAYKDEQYAGFLVLSILSEFGGEKKLFVWVCLLYTSPSPRDGLLSRMPSSA